MPVRELTERPTIPRLGKIRLGDRGGRNNAPRNMPHFVVPEEVAAIYGPEPTELKIVFLSDDPEIISSQYYRAYNASSGLICKGDGYNADALLDAAVLKRNGGELTVESWAHGGEGDRATTQFVRQQIGCAGAGYEGAPACPMFAAKKCAVRNFLQFAIVDVPGLGVYQLDTGSLISTRQINGAIEMARLTVGGIRGVPCTLRRVKRDVSPDGKKKGVWMVELEIDTAYSLTDLIELRGGPLSKLLLPPVDETEIYDHVEDDEEEDESRPPDNTPLRIGPANGPGIVQPPSSPVVKVNAEAISARLKAINASWDKDAFDRLMAQLRERWPVAIQGDVWKALRLEQRARKDVLAFLDEQEGAPPVALPAAVEESAPAAEQAPLLDAAGASTSSSRGYH